MMTLQQNIECAAWQIHFIILEGTLQLINLRYQNWAKVYVLTKYI